MENKKTISSIWQRTHLDGWLLLILVIASLGSLLIFYSAIGSNEAMFLSRVKQMLIGFAVMIIVAQFPPRFYQKIAPYLYTISIILLLLVLIIGSSSKGAQRWLDLSIIRFQPSEIAKITVPLLIAMYLGRNMLPPNFKHIIIAIGLTMLPTLLVALQPDLGTAILICATGGFVIFLAGISWKFIATAIAGLVAFAPIMWSYLMHDYQRTRILTLFNADQDPLGKGYNILQSKIAIGSGGFWGKGWLNGTQSQLDFIPEHHTDFIFSVLAEEFGLFGVLILFAIYFIIIGRTMIIAIYAQTAFDKLLASSIAAIFFVYMSVNIGMVSDLLPVVGVPLPLISYGGTSFVVLMLCFGLVMSIQTHKRPSYDH